MMLSFQMKRNVKSMNGVVVKRASQKRSLVLVIVVAAQGIILQIAMREPMWMEMNLIRMRIKIQTASKRNPFL